MKHYVLPLLAMGWLLVIPCGAGNTRAQAPASPTTQGVSAADQAAVAALVRQLKMPGAARLEAMKNLEAMGEPARLTLTKMVQDGSLDPQVVGVIKGSILIHLNAQKARADRLAAQTTEADRLAEQKAEASRLAAQKADDAWLAAQKAEADRLAAQKAEADRLAAQNASDQRLAATQPADHKAASPQTGAPAAAASNGDTSQANARKLAETAAILKLHAGYRRSDEKDPTSPIAELYFEGTKVTDDDLTLLQDLPCLRKLALRGTGISDAGLEHLLGLTQLEYLSLDGTKVTERAVRKLREQLPQCRVVSNFGDSAKAPKGPPPTYEGTALIVLLVLLTGFVFVMWWRYSRASRGAGTAATTGSDLTPDMRRTLRQFERVVLVGLLILVVLPGAVFGYLWSFPQAIRSYGWVKTPCDIENAGLVSSTSTHHSGTFSRLRAVYRYEYQGQTYRSMRVKFSNEGVPRGGSPFKDDVWYAHLYKTGSMADCYVDPHNPSEATLVPGLTFIMWGLVIWCAVAGGLGLMAWRFLRRQRRGAAGDAWKAEVAREAGRDGKGS